jgi:hypothetical protein
MAAVSGGSHRMSTSTCVLVSCVCFGVWGGVGGGVSDGFGGVLSMWVRVGV